MRPARRPISFDGGLGLPMPGEAGSAEDSVSGRQKPAIAGVTLPARDAGKKSLLREHGGGAAEVSYLELFVDLVFVFAITQLSHYLVEHLSWLGLAQTIVMFLAIWWAWIYTTWAANWINPDRVRIRVMLLGVMLGSMILAIALPKAFATNGLLFAVAYLAIQIGRTAFTAVIMRGRDPGNSMSMVRITVWFCASAPLWIVGALDPDPGNRLMFWVAALAIEYAGPAMFFRTPFLGSTRTSDWAISGSHMAERCALFIIIALGEGIIITGATFAKLEPDAAHVAAFMIAFTGSALMWWVYFDVGAVRGAEHIEHHAEPGRVARNTFTYLHMPIVAGIVLTAVADELLLTHPAGPVPQALIITQCGGLIVFLIGTGLFKRPTSRLKNFPLSHSIGLALLAVQALWGWFILPETLAFAGVSIAILIVVTVWEWISFHGGWRERIRPMASRWR